MYGGKVRDQDVEKVAEYLKKQRRDLGQGDYKQGDLDSALATFLGNEEGKTAFWEPPAPVPAPVPAPNAALSPAPPAPASLTGVVATAAAATATAAVGAPSVPAPARHQRRRLPSRSTPTTTC